MAFNPNTTQTVLENIHIQPEILADAFTSRGEIIDPFVAAFTAAPVSRVVFIGSGTSYNVSNLALSLFNRIVKVDATAPYPTEFANYGVGLNPAEADPSSVLCVAISQSGTSISTCDALAVARQKGFRTLVLTCDPESRAASLADTVVPLLAGDEQTGPETRGYTASVLSVYLWAHATAAATGALTAAEADAAIAEAGDVVDRFQEVIEESEAWYDRNRPGLLHAGRINILGLGIDYGTMLEGTLKVAEMLRVPVIGNLVEEHMHGPTYALRPDHGNLIVGSDEAEFDRIIAIRNALREHAPATHVITCRDFEGADERDIVFSVKAGPFLAPLLYTVPFQFLAAKGGKDVHINTNHNPVPIHFGHLEG